MKFIVSVVSNGHENLIIQNKLFESLLINKKTLIICRDNKGSKTLKNHCDSLNVIYIRNTKARGFSENNNLNFIYYLEHYHIGYQDFFMLINPDILIKNDNLNRLYGYLKKNRNKDCIFTANLFVDVNQTVQDDNIRLYPNFLDFVKSYLFKQCRTKLKRDADFTTDNKNVWCSGAFMAMPCSVFYKLNGLEETFFLYCEDIDIHRRANLHSIYLDYIQDIYITHMHRRDSKKLFSKYFLWHVTSVFIYLILQKNKQPIKSSLMSWKIKQEKQIPQEWCHEAH